MANGARHMGTTAEVGLWVKGEGERGRDRERQPTKDKQWLREREGSCSLPEVGESVLCFSGSDSRGSLNVTSGARHGQRELGRLRPRILMPVKSSVALNPKLYTWHQVRDMDNESLVDFDLDGRWVHIPQSFICAAPGVSI